MIMIARIRQDFKERRKIILLYNQSLKSFVEKSRLEDSTRELIALISVNNVTFLK